MADFIRTDQDLLPQLLPHSSAEVLGMISFELMRHTYSIDGCAKLLEQEEVSSEAKTKFIEYIKVNTQKMHQLLNAGYEYLEKSEGMPNPYKVD